MARVKKDVDPLLLLFVMCETHSAGSRVRAFRPFVLGTSLTGLDEYEF